MTIVGSSFERDRILTEEESWQPERVAGGGAFKLYYQEIGSVRTRGSRK